MRQSGTKQENAGRGPAVPLSAIALAVAFLAAAPQPARAVNECGAEAAGADTITCTGASYATGINYTNSNGLTLNLDNPAMVVQANGTTAVGIVGAVGNNNDLVINAVNLTSITGTGSPSVLSVRNSGNGRSIIRIDGGAIGGPPAATVRAENTAGSGDVLITLNGGQINSTSNVFSATGVHATSSGSATGSATVVMTGGSVTMSSAVAFGLRASNSNTVSAAASTVLMSGGTVSSSGMGLYANHFGLGEAAVMMTG
ncbi:MAG TPA: autotransporter outer membrane beta-barrel domain-containing protein, partial [Ramlibacter sp.]|nr:autotransporter outer membrane beta-barrel domain-containing protein [Ramlibacter sp.]